MSTLGSAYVQILPSTKGISEKISSALSGVSSTFSNSGTSAGSGFGTALSVAAGNLITGFVTTAASEIKDVTVESVNLASSFETASAKLATIAGSGELSGLQSDILTLSNSTGVAAADLAEVAYNAISAGTSVDNAVNVAGAATKLATAGFTDSSSALKVLTTAMNAYGETAGTATDISDSLIQVQNMGVTTVAELSNSIGKSIAMGSAYGVSLGNIESSYVSLTKQGIGTAEATTYMNSMIKELGDSGSTVSGILQDKTGKSFGQLMSSGASLADVIGILTESVDGDTEAFANLWGSAEGGLAASAIINEGLDAFNDNLNELQNSAGATADAYDLMADTFQHKSDLLKTQLQNVGIAIGNEILPYISNAMSLVQDNMPAIQNAVSGVVNFVGSALSSVSGFISSHSEQIGSAVEVIGGILSSAGSAIGTVFESIKTAISTVSESMSNISVDWGGIWEGIGTVISTAGEIIGAAIEAIGTGIATIVTEATTEGTLLNETFTAIGEVVDAVGAYIELAAGIIVSAFQNIGTEGTALNDVWTAVQEVATVVWENINTVISTTADVIQSVVSGVTAIMQGDWSGALNAMGDITSSVWSAIQSCTSNAASVIGSIVSAAWSLLQSVTSAAWSAISGITSAVWSAICSVVSGVASSIQSAIQSAWSAVQSATSAAWNAVSSAVTSVITGLVSTVSGMASNVVSTIQTMGSNMLSAVSGLPAQFMSVGANIINGIISGISNAAGALYSTLRNLASSALSAAKSALGIGSPSKKFRDMVGQWIPAGIAVGIERGSDSVYDALDNLNNGMLSYEFGSVKSASFTAAGNGSRTQIVQNIYSTKQTAADIFKEAAWNQRRAVMVGA